MSSHGLTSSIHRIERDAGRLREIIGVLAKYGLSNLLETVPVPGMPDLAHRVEDPEVRDLTREERIRLALTDLGPTFIKAGQVMSTRADVVGPVLAKELTSLQSDTPFDPPEVVVATVERELGRRVADLFAYFDPDAFASASIAQVHKARLHTGEWVVVKIQREGIQAKIEADLSILESFAHLGENHSSALKDYEAVRLVHEFRRTLLHELDFIRERTNLDTFAKNFEDDETVRFPRTWAELSTRRILTMDYLDGVPGTQMEAMAATGEDLDAFAQRGANVYLNMIFRDGFYHADPHPGNLMLLPDGVVGIIDCGMVGRIDDGLRDDLESLVMAITQGDAETLTDTLWRLSRGQTPEARDEMRADLTDLLGDYGEGSLGPVDISATLHGLLAVFRKYRVALRPGLSSLLRTLVLLDGTARLLSPQFNLAEVLRPYQEDAIRRRLSPDRLLHRVQRHYIEWDRLLDTLPRDINETLAKVRAGEFRVGLEHRHLDSVVNRLVTGIICSSLFLGSSLLWSMKAPPLIQGVSFFGAIGYLVALWLGWTLYRAIHDSGKVAPKD